jgi:hypothetical protein
MANEKRLNPNPQNLSELDPERDVDPLTDTRTVAQTPTDDNDIVELPADENGVRTGNYDRTTGTAHPSEDSGADQGTDTVE